MTANNDQPKMEYVRLGKSGLKVSKVIVGAMSYGSPEWTGWVLDEEAALPILKHAYDAGINTWDTADVYSNGESERIIGKAIKKYGLAREKLVILTKCFFRVETTGAQPFIHDEPARGQFDRVNQVGLSRKHIFDAVQASVERLGTHIDVLQIHRLDHDVPPEEIMKALNDVIERGWVRYIGASSMWTWQFQQLQWIAKINGWHQFISMQNYHNLLYREEEREMIPYCDATGVGRIPWSPVARGALCRPWNERTSVREQTDRLLDSIRKGQASADKAIVDRVEEVAKKRGVSMTCIATAWSIHKGNMPIIGLSSTKRVDEAVFNATYKLSEEDVKYLEEPYQPKPIFGHA